MVGALGGGQLGAVIADDVLDRVTRAEFLLADAGGIYSKIKNKYSFKL